MRLAHSFGNFRNTNFYDAKIKEIDVDNNPGLQWDAMLRYHFKVNPDELEDKDYFKLIASLEWVIRMENEKYKD